MTHLTDARKLPDSRSTAAAARDQGEGSGHSFSGLAASEARLKMVAAAGVRVGMFRLHSLVGLR